MPDNSTGINVHSSSKESTETQVVTSVRGFRYVWPLLLVLAFLSLFFAEVVSSYFLAADDAIFNCRAVGRVRQSQTSQNERV